MTQRQQPFFALVGALLLSFFVGLFLFGKKRQKKQNTSDNVRTHHIVASPEATLAYWTDDKKREASAMPLPVADEHASETKKTHEDESSQN